MNLTDYAINQFENKRQEGEGIQQIISDVNFEIEKVERNLENRNLSMPAREGLTIFKKGLVLYKEGLITQIICPGN